jgi:hypothetical protein
MFPQEKHIQRIAQDPRLKEHAKGASKAARAFDQ